LTPDWLADVRPGLASALRDSLPELEWIDRDLELEDGRRVDVVGVDGGGRATALLLVGEDEQEALLTALDTLAWFARHRSLLDGHFAHARLDAARTPRVVLVAEGYSDRMLARLAGLDPAVVQAFELRHVTSQRNARAYLVPARPAPLEDAPDDPTGARALLRALDPEAADLAERLLRRLARADDELDLAADGSGVRCTLDGEALCGLRARRGSLLGWVGEREPEPLLSVEDGEAWIERVLRELRRLLPAGPAPGGSAAGVSRGAGAGGGDGEGEGPDPFDPSTPLLTAEEISAFQDP